MARWLDGSMWPDGIGKTNDKEEQKNKPKRKESVENELQSNLY